MLLGNSIGMPLYLNYVAGIGRQIEDQKKRLAAETDPAKQAALRAQIAVNESNRKAQDELRPTAPNVTLTDHMTLYRGSREIQIRHLGRGHTAGDVVVFLPREKVVMTVDRHANTSAASIPLALAAARADGRIKHGDLVLLEAMGGGFTWGALLLRW